AGFWAAGQLFFLPPPIGGSQSARLPTRAFREGTAARYRRLARRARRESGSTASPASARARGISPPLRHGRCVEVSPISRSKGRGSSPTRWLGGPVAQGLCPWCSQIIA